MVPQGPESRQKLTSFHKIAWLQNGAQRFTTTQSIFDVRISRALVGSETSDLPESKSESAILPWTKDRGLRYLFSIIFKQNESFDPRSSYVVGFSKKLENKQKKKKKLIHRSEQTSGLFSLFVIL